MAISGRGPGEVNQFAKQAKEHKGEDDPKWQGVLDALSWALGDKDKILLPDRLTVFQIWKLLTIQRSRLNMDRQKV